MGKIIKVKPCGCIVKEGGVIILCPKHAEKAESAKPTKPSRAKSVTQFS